MYMQWHQNWILCILGNFQNVSAFLKREESYDLAAGFPKTSKIVHWVASATVQAYLEEDINFFDGLEHNIEQPLPVKVKKTLKSHFKSLKQEYEAPNSFCFTILHPCLSYLWLLTDDDNNNYCSFGFANAQVAISTAFLYGKIPLMKTIERMTNPYFQDIDSCQGLER